MCTLQCLSIEYDHDDDNYNDNNNTAEKIQLMDMKQLGNTLINYPNSVTQFCFSCKQAWNITPVTSTDVTTTTTTSRINFMMETIKIHSYLLDYNTNPNGILKHFIVQESNLQADHGQILSNGIMTNNHLLTTLSLQRKNITDDSIQSFAEAIGMNHSIQDLDLYFNYIGDMGAQCLANAISQNQSLRKVDLSHNQIGDDGAVALVQGIMRRQYPPSTTNRTFIDPHQVHQQNKRCPFDLDLSYHRNIGDVTAKALASLLHMQHSALVPTVTLTRLSLSNCSIGDDGIQALADALRGCFYNDKNRAKNYNNCRFGGLEELTLGNNHISDVGCVHLADALKQNNILMYLDLHCNHIGRDGGCAICQILESNNDSLTFIEISGNPCEYLYYNTEWTIGNICATNSVDREQQYSDPHHHQQQQEQPKQVVATEKEKYYQRIKLQNILQFSFLGMRMNFVTHFVT